MNFYLTITKKMLIDSGLTKYLVKTIRENQFINFHGGKSMTKLLITFFLKEEMSSLCNVSFNKSYKTFNYTDSESK